MSLPTTGRIPRAYAWIVVRLRWPIVAAWAAVVAYAVFVLPAPVAPPDTLVSLVPAHSPAVRANILALHTFRAPLSTEVAVVHRDPSGLSKGALANIASAAARVDRKARRHPGSGPIAVPVINAHGVVPGSRETGTTAITYLVYPLSMSTVHQIDGANRLRGGGGHVTGILPAEVHEGGLVDDALPLIEAATVVLLALLVGVRFRALGAPLLTLAAVGTAYTLAEQAVSHAARRAGLEQPSLLRPLLVALVLGIVTDYVVFYLSHAQTKTLVGSSRLEAAQQATAETTPIVIAGGAILTASLLALRVARTEVLQQLGPALALAVAVAVLVAVTLVPAALAILGRALYWPRPPEPDTSGAENHPARGRNAVARLIAHRSAALVVGLACTAALVLAAAKVRETRLAVTTIPGLPSSAQERIGADDAARGFAAGMLAPAQVIVARPGIADETAGLARLEEELRRQPGVAAVVGPGDMPFVRRHGVLTSSSGGAARLLVVYRTDPYGATALAQVGALRGHLPALAADAGLGRPRTALAGDGPVAHDTVAAVRGDLVRVVAAVLVVNLVLLVLFLRALIAPILLVAASALSVAAAIGIATWTFQTAFGYSDLTYYVPFAAGVLLVSLGSDYNVFVAGRVWQEARVRPLREALRIAPARSAAAVRTAGITLAASFGLLAIVPVRAFRELAFTMAVGILLDTFVVRPLLVPSLVSLFGEASGWPGRALTRGRRVAVDGE
ncbi:MAG TPA: MMPL family transporter [Gaiellales bacterium]|jgi:RND superfamily putative drug exporter